MSEPQDWIAIGPHGVYAACVSDPIEKSLIVSFKRAAKRRGHTVELVGREEAHQRMMEYRRRINHAQAAYDAAIAETAP